MKYRILFLFLIFFNCLPLQAQNKTKKYYFYHPEITYGSEPMLSPAVLFINGAFDVLRNGGHENNGETINIFKLDYRQGFTNIWENVSKPAYHISRYGWNRFLKQEVFPASLKPNKAQWVPNYGHHIIGSGMLWVRMAEWYDFHGYPSPKLLSFVTTTAYQIMNEALENNHSRLTNVDPIADLLIFNPLGFVLFSFDAVKEFFSHTVRMYDWSLQPLFNPFNQYLENAGLQFTFKYTLNHCWDIFFYYGIYGIGGLSYTFNSNQHFSFGAGTVVNRLEENIEHQARFITPSTDGAIGFFYDQNNSLLTSVLLTGPRLLNARINIYPGLIEFGGFKPGFYVGIGQWDGFIAGVTLMGFPIGLGTETADNWKK